MCGVFIFIVHIFALALDYFFFLYHYHFVLYGLYIDRRISVCYKCVTHIWIVHFRFASDWFSHFQTFYTWFWRTFYIFISSRSHYIFPSKFFEFSEALTIHTDDAWNMWICIGTMHETCEYHPRSDAFWEIVRHKFQVINWNFRPPLSCGIWISTRMIPYQAGDCCS